MHHITLNQSIDQSINRSIEQSIISQSINQSINQSTTFSSCGCYLVPWRSVFPWPKYRPTRTLRAKKQRSLQIEPQRQKNSPLTSLLSFRHSMWSKSILTYKLYCTPRSTSSPECSSAQELLPPDPCPLLPWPPPWPCPWWSHIVSNRKKQSLEIPVQKSSVWKKHKKKISGKRKIFSPDPAVHTSTIPKIEKNSRIQPGQWKSKKASQNELLMLSYFSLRISA